MNSDLERLCNAARAHVAACAKRDEQPSTEGIVRAVLTEMLEPSDSIADYIDEYIQFCAARGRFIHEIRPADGQLAAAAFVGSMRAFLREEDD